MSVTRRRGATVALITAVVLIATTCSDSTPITSRAATGPTTIPPGGSEVIPKVGTSPLLDATQRLVTVRAGGGRLYVSTSSDGLAVEIRRIDPASGATLATGSTVDVHGWVPTEWGVLVSHTDLHHFSLLDADTLGLRHRITLPGDARSPLYRDVINSDATWLGAHRRDEDQLAGRYTSMSAIRLDLANGTVTDQRDTPPCGPHSVTQVHRSLLMLLVCTYEITRIELDSGEVESTAGFPSAGSPATLGDDVWFRWKALGYIARIKDAGAPGALERIETLDLNTDGPVLIGLSGFEQVGDSVLIAGNPSGLSGRLLFRVDRHRFQVTGRAWIPGEHAIVGDQGFAIDDGALVRFDPATIEGAATRRTVRPRRGAPPEVAPHTPDEEAVVETFSSVWDVSRANEQIAHSLGNDLQLLDLRSKLVALVNQTYPGVTTRVTAIAVSGETASISYVFLRDDKLVFPPFTATLTKFGDRWQVDRDAVCQIATKAAVSTC